MKGWSVDIVSGIDIDSVLAQEVHNIDIASLDSPKQNGVVITVTNSKIASILYISEDIILIALVGLLENGVLGC